MPEATRKLIIDGNGVTVSQGQTEIGNITEIGNLPGWSKAEIDDTALDNETVATYIMGNLKTWTDLAITVKMGGVSAVSEENSRWTVNFPNTSGGLVFWGQLKEQGSPSIKSGEGVTVPLTIKPTNTSGGVIIPPIFGSEL